MPGQVFQVKRNKEDDNYSGVYWLLYNVNFGAVHFMSQADFNQLEQDAGKPGRYAK